MIYALAYFDEEGESFDDGLPFIHYGVVESLEAVRMEKELFESLGCVDVTIFGAEEEELNALGQIDWNFVNTHKIN